MSVCLGVGLLTGAVHYLVNLARFRTPVYPFIDRRLATALYGGYYYPEQTGKLEQIRELFWGWPNRLLDIASFDSVQGAFSFLWYPVPLFIVVSMIIAWREGNRPFLIMQGVLVGMLLCDPAPAIGRYTMWYQGAGFLSTALVAQRVRAFRLIYLAPLAYAGLAAYMLVAPRGLLEDRRQLGRRFAVLEGISRPTAEVQYYYDIYSPCSGYYWYLRYRNVVPRVVAKPPRAEEVGSHVYIAADHRRNCWTALVHQADVDLRVAQRGPTGLWLDVRVKDPFAMRECTICGSDYGCMYLPRDLSTPLRFPTAGQKAVRVHCTTWDGQRIERRAEFDAR
jgi:hypothetical protein